MASCGPSNPLQSAKDHLQRDTSLQRDQVAALPGAQPWAATSAGFRGVGHSHQPGPEAARAQFESFNQFAPSVGMERGLERRGMPMAVDSSQTRGATGYISEQNPLAQNTGHQWAAEFQQGPQAADRQGSPFSFNTPRSGQSMWPYMAPNPAAAAYGQLGAVPGAVPTLGQQPPRAAPAPPSEAVFEEMFAAFEKKLENESKQQQKAETAPRQDTEDLSGIASEIINTLSSSDSERSHQLAEKMQSSKFMALMDKLKTSEVKASKTDFVASQGDKVDPYSLEATTTNFQENTSQQAEQSSRAPLEANADWPPQRRDTSLPPFGRNWRDASFLIGLDDPDTYFNKLRANLRATNKLAAEMPSPFEAARDLGPRPVRVGDWEENYESW